MSSHPSERPTWTSAGSLQAVLFGLASGGVCPAAASPRRWCALTAPFHPCPLAVHVGRPTSAVCFCGTFPRVSPGRSRPPCPVMSGLSSKANDLRGCLTYAINLAHPNACRKDAGQAPLNHSLRNPPERPAKATARSFDGRPQSHGASPRAAATSRASARAQHNCVPHFTHSPYASSTATPAREPDPPQDAISPPHIGQQIASHMLSRTHASTIRPSSVVAPPASARAAGSTPLERDNRSAGRRTSRPSRPGRPGRQGRLWRAALLIRSS